MRFNKIKFNHQKKKLSMSLTKIKDVDMLILQKMDDETLFNFCSTSRYGAELCRNENFWQKRLFERFGATDKPGNSTWKNFYLEIIFYLENTDDYNKAMLYAVNDNNLDMVKFFLTKGLENNSITVDEINYAMAKASVKRFSYIMHYLHSKGGQYNALPAILKTIYKEK